MEGNKIEVCPICGSKKLIYGALKTMCIVCGREVIPLVSPQERRVEQWQQQKI